MSVPSLIGGIALRSYDLPAASIFAAAYGLLLPVFLYRMCLRRYRTWIICSVISFSIERAIVFCLRAVVASKPNTESEGLSEYMQLSFAGSFVYLAHDVCKLLRCILVNSTKGPEPPSDSCANPIQPPLVSTDSGLWQFKLSPPGVVPGTADDPRRRFWFRRWFEGMTILFLAAVGTAIASTIGLFKPDDLGLDHRNQALRHASATIGLVLLLCMALIIAWARQNIPQLDRRAVRFVLVATTVLMVPPIYRLCVMYHTTADLKSLNHAAQNTLQDKVLFYFFNVLPEWTVAAMMCSFDVKDIFQTGLNGDERWRDETPKERAKREKKAQEKAQKQAQKKDKSFEMSSRSSRFNSAETLA
ncbi:hypothetical protein C8J57DRAFT_1491141 [Mycena rebaudengoi]|nr:hypothetical protein C8J57DRAFT_1491141 [Mycena rebaudengoi]